MRYAAILDTETQGLDPTQHRCIEVAVCLFDLVRAIPVASYASLLRAESNEAEAVNRIPVGALLDAREPESVWKAVRHFVDRADVVVAHRAEFDRSFMPSDMQTLRPFCCSKFHIEWPNGKPGDHLVHLALAHGIGVVSAHRAMTDVDILSRLLTRVHEMGHPLVPLIERAMRPRVRIQSLQRFEDNELAKAHGFTWDAATRMWWRDVSVDDLDAEQAKWPFDSRLCIPESAP